MSSVASQDSSTSSKCQTGIAASLDHLSCSLGRLSFPQETTLFSLLTRCYDNFVSVFALEDQSNILPSTERLLSSIFDTGSRAFVLEKSSRILGGLPDHDKVCLFIQAVAGMAMVFQRLGSAEAELSHRLLSRELQLFAESEQRHSMLDKIAASHLLSSCYTKSEAIAFLMGILKDCATDSREDLPLTTVGEETPNDSVSWVSDRPCKNMGLPWGFTIMAIN
ncbi:hypothetical protein B0H66DRAFT_574238 [Apodospora peruviana]|uniref:Uncharacterized protein n=1 Tax=Apodospora peruviana TaxID=516989 RepID=A0AAE0M715_9PEZI|nr:hypothetical protein B0H66DRAFT_574238 [Apodospora peruviana]